jgi:ketosteroid isomerase-like protein
MSQENVELVRSGAEALARGDLDAMRRFLDPAFEFDVTRTDLNPRVYHGLEGLLELMSEWSSTWDDYEWRSPTWSRRGKIASPASCASEAG